MTLGARIREYRNKRGFTQGQMADKLNMTEANFSSYERDKSIPPSAKLSEISAILNVSTDYLLGLESTQLDESQKELTSSGTQTSTQAKGKTVIYVDEGELIDLSSYSETEKEQIKDFIKFIKSQKEK